MCSMQFSCAVDIYVIWTVGSDDGQYMQTLVLKKEYVFLHSIPQQIDIICLVNLESRRIDILQRENADLSQCHHSDIL